MAQSGRAIFSGHIVILGDSRYRDIILAELSETELTDRRAVVVMSEREPLPESMAGGMAIRYVRGNPENTRDLEQVAPCDASAALVLSAGGVDGDASAARVVDALIACTRKTAVLPASRTGAIVAVTETEEWRRQIGSTGGSRVHTVCWRTLFARIVALAATQRHLSTLLRELLTFRGNDFYVVPAGDLAGLTYASALRASDSACVAGMMRDGRVTLNPPMETPIGKNDSLVIIAPDSKRFARSETIIPAPEAECIAENPISAQSEGRFLFLGWNTLCPTIAKALARLTEGKAHLTVVAEEGAPPPELLQDDIAAATERIVADPASRETLDAIPWECFENVIIPGNEACDDGAALDLHALARAALAARGFDNNLTTVLLDPLSGETGGDGGRFVSAEIAFRVIARFLINPEIAAVVRHLIAETGATVRLKPAARYVKIGVETHFYTILEAARRKNETAIGYIASEGSRIVLNPPKAGVVRFCHLDRIVVLAD